MANDLLCFSHLRWDFVFQRPNHLMVRAARDRRVFYVEEPVGGIASEPTLSITETDGVVVVTPHLPDAVTDRHGALRQLLDRLVDHEAIERPVLWYYTPMALPWSQHLGSSAVVYDCMDHLAGFKGAPAGMDRLEKRLVSRADLLLTGGARLHAAKSRGHANGHCFPSSVEIEHFRAARGAPQEPADQAPIPRPRLGYAGVIDERIDLDLIGTIARAEPDWSVVLLGPVTKIDRSDIPAEPNIHLLGRKDYAELPSYLAGWEVGIMPFAHNDATRFISPTKTPEYLAAGLRVASTSIHDVVDPYGGARLAEIGDGAAGFLEACRRAMALPLGPHLARADAFLADRSWDRTWAAMDALLRDAVAGRRSKSARERRPAVVHGNGLRPLVTAVGRARSFEAEVKPRRSRVEVPARVHAGVARPSLEGRASLAPRHVQAARRPGDVTSRD